MSRTVSPIITLGYGPDSMIITKGYGLVIVVPVVIPPVPIRVPRVVIVRFPFRIEKDVVGTLTIVFIFKFATIGTLIKSFEDLRLTVLGTISLMQQIIIPIISTTLRKYLLTIKTIGALKQVISSKISVTGYLLKKWTCQILVIGQKEPLETEVVDT